MDPVQPASGPPRGPDTVPGVPGADGLAAPHDTAQSLSLSPASERALMDGAVELVARATSWKSGQVIHFSDSGSGVSGPPPAPAFSSDQ